MKHRLVEAPARDASRCMNLLCTLAKVLRLNTTLSATCMGQRRSHPSWPNDPVQPPARKEPERTCQTSTRVGWNGGLGGWAERQCRLFINIAHFFIRRNTRITAIAPYSVIIQDNSNNSLTASARYLQNNKYSSLDCLIDLGSSIW